MRTGLDQSHCGMKSELRSVHVRVALLTDVFTGLTFEARLPPLI